jgi:hypothetical protein
MQVGDISCVLWFPADEPQGRAAKRQLDFRNSGIWQAGLGETTKPYLL